MTCQKCGQPEHPAVDCFAALWGELKRKEIVTEQLYEACKEAKGFISRNEWRSLYFPNPVPILTQLELAIQRAEEESDGA